MSDRRTHSIRWRLLLRMGIGFGMLLLIISVLLWNYSRTAANKTYDLLLSGAALSILERVSVGPHGATVDIPTSAMEILGLTPNDRLVYSVFSFASGNITGQTDLPAMPDLAPATEPAYFDADYNGSTYRFVVESRPLTVANQREWVGVQIGQTREARQAQQIALFASGMAGLAAVSLIGLAAVWIAISTALRPLQRIETQLAERNPSDLTPMTGTPPHEVASLFGEINSFIDRLAASRRLNETFMADVAHQTRTSLSALQGQLALASDAQTPQVMTARVAKAGAQAERCVRLTNQLLSNAMVIHRSEPANLTPTPLTPLVRDVIGDFMRESLTRDVTFTLDAEVPAAKDLVLGDDVSIREALRNLIDNAIRHGPPDNIIDVDLRLTDHDDIVLSVSDAGPGIPPDRRDQVTERFVSTASSNKGSGLGLAIVQAVANSHKGHLILEDSPRGGLRAKIVFPRLRRHGPRRIHGAAALLLALAAALALPGQIRAETAPLIIYSATDSDAFLPLVRAYQDQNPDQPIEYREFQTRDLYEAMRAGDTAPDLVISPAMDLQVDLVNRGMARPISLTNAARLPGWAQWRSELFGLTFEPAVVAYDPQKIPPDQFPRTHQDLAGFIRTHQDALTRHIGTYDVTVSGIGYLYATQEVVQGLEAQRMTEVLGRAETRLFCCTSLMLDGIVSGDLTLAVSLIGSYALARAQDNPAIAVTLMDDYNLVMSRSVFVPKTAASPEEAAKFIDFMISATGQDLMAQETQLIPIRPSPTLDHPTLAILRRYEGTFLPMPLRPSLLTYLDRLKMQRFIDGWTDAMQSARPNLTGR